MYTNKQFHFSFIVLLLLLYGAVGCVDDFKIVQTDSQARDNTLVTFFLNDEKIQDVKTRAVDESTITDAHVLIFSSTGRYVLNKYSTGSTITMSIPSGSEYAIYVIANTAKSTLFEGSGAAYLKDEATFLSMMQTYDVIGDASVNNRLVMTGFKKNVKIDGNNQSITNFTLERIVAKVNLNITTAPGISITGYSIKNLHTLTYLIARPNPNESDLNDLTIGDDYDVNQVANYTKNIEFTTTDMSNITFYMYQNRAGGRKQIAGGLGKLNDESEKAKYAPDRATYIEIRTKGNTYTEAKHRIYLGADNSQNYSIKRNGVYTYTVYIKDKMNADTRIDRLEAPSNCYIVQPNGRVTFPVSRANEGLTQQITSTNYTAEVYWIDNNKGMSASGTIKSVAVNTANGTITVDTGSMSGNAVLVVKVGGVIAWSWHIWVTDYNPTTTNISYVNNNKTIVFMDRNLGAANSNVDNVGSMGLLYQWGRKDPFPGANNFLSTSPSLIYDVNGVLLKEGGTGVKKVAVAVPNNLDNSIKNPLTIYFNKATSGDWFSNNGQKNDDLWSGAAGSNKKSAYDPCPVGWRVPLSGGLSASPWYKKNSTLLGTYTNGWNWTDPSYSLGWYPAVITRASVSGSLTSSSSSYWAASAYNSTGNAYSLAFSKTTVATNYSQVRSVAAAVRCVKL